MGNKLKQFWAGEWNTLLTTVTDRADDRGSRARTGERDVKAEARKARMLMDMAEVRRATSMATDPIEVASGDDVPENLKRLFPAGEAYKAPRVEQQGGVAQEGQETFMDALKRAVLHAPRKLAPGLGGSRFEHWRMVGQVPGGEDHFAIMGANMVDRKSTRLNSSHSSVSRMPSSA